MSRLLTYGILSQPLPYKIFIGGNYTQSVANYNNIAKLNSDLCAEAEFSIGTGFNNVVESIAVQSDGKILVGGQFTSYNGTTSNRIIRLNADGSIDTGFSIGTGFNSTVRSIAVQSDGKILVGGQFTSYNGNTRNSIIRLNADGSIDTGFSIGTGFNNTVVTIAVQSDGKILAGGAFSSYDGNSRNYIIRLNSDGSDDTTNFAIGTGFGSFVFSIAIQSDGKVLVGGNFTSYNGNTRNRIVRLNTDGSDDTSNFAIGTGFNQAVYSIAIQSDDKVLAGGAFTSYNGTTRNRIIRLNSDGSDDTTNFAIGTGFNNIVYSIAIQSDGKVLAGGAFSSYNNNFSITRIAKLNTNGSISTDFSQGRWFNNTIFSIAAQGDNIVVGGQFSVAPTFLLNRFSKFKNNGELTHNFSVSTGFNGQIWSSAVKSNGKILVVGFFTSYRGTSRNRIIQLNPDGSIDTDFSIGTGFGSLVQSMTLQGDEKILVGGWFTSYNGTASNRIVRLNTNGSIDTGFSIGTGFNSIVYSIAIQSDDKVLVGGDFTSYNGNTRNRIVRLNTDGSDDTTNFVIGTGFNSTVRSIVVQSDGKILVGGAFTSYDSTTSNRIIRLNSDGSIDTGFSIGTGFNNTVNSIAIQSDGKILVGGNFTSYNGTTSNRIIRLNTDGSIDAGFSIGTGFNGQIWSITVQSDGKVLVGGDFPNYNGTTVNRIIRLNSDGSIDTGFNLGFNSTVSAITLTKQ